MNSSWEIQLAEAIFQKAEDKLRESVIYLYKSGRLNVYPEEVLAITDIVPDKSLLEYLFSLEELLEKESFKMVYSTIKHNVALLMDEVEEIL